MSLTGHHRAARNELPHLNMSHDMGIQGRGSDHKLRPPIPIFGAIEIESLRHGALSCGAHLTSD